MEFLSVVFNMGLVRKPTLAEYWSTRGSHSMPWFRKMFPRNRFQLILKFFHVVDNRKIPKRNSPQYRYTKLHFLIYKYKLSYWYTIYLEILTMTNMRCSTSLFFLPFWRPDMCEHNVHEILPTPTRHLRWWNFSRDQRQDCNAAIYSFEAFKICSKGLGFGRECHGVHR